MVVGQVGDVDAVLASQPVLDGQHRDLGSDSNRRVLSPRWSMGSRRS